jgi:hypothetical protein
MKLDEENARRMAEYYKIRDAEDRALREREITSRAADRTADNAFRERQLAWQMGNAKIPDLDPETIEAMRKSGVYRIPLSQSGSTVMRLKSEVSSPGSGPIEQGDYYWAGTSWKPKPKGAMSGLEKQIAGISTPQQKQTRISQLETEIEKNPSLATVRSGFDLPGETRAQALSRLRREMRMTPEVPSAPPVQAPAPAVVPAPAATPRPTPYFGVRPTAPRPATATPAPMPTAATGTAPSNQDPAAVLQQARDAIGRGAPREKVLQRLQSMGIDATGLDAPPPEQLPNMTVR